MQLSELKKSIRKKAQRIRAEQPDKERISGEILGNLFGLEQFLSAQTILLYLDHKSEVRTRFALEDFLLTGKKILVPYCEGDDLNVFWLRHVDELEPGSFDILEPAEELRRAQERKVPLGEIDLVLVPGLAFDKNGGRLGYGKGYYDRFLSQVSLSCLLVGLAYDSQIFSSVPMSEQDMPLDIIVTQSRIFEQGNQS